jgi:hypothetical protein
MRTFESCLMADLASASLNMDKSPEPENEKVTVRQSDEAASPGAVPGAALIGEGFRLVDVIGATPGLVTVPDLVKATGWSRPKL